MRKLFCTSQTGGSSENVRLSFLLKHATFVTYARLWDGNVQGADLLRCLRAMCSLCRTRRVERSAVFVVFSCSLAAPSPAQYFQVYSIRRSLFDDTYSLDDRRNHLPTQEEVLVRWTAELQNGRGGVHRKPGIVFAKAVSSTEASTSVSDGDMTIELSVVEHDQIQI